jgi:hypothetical protein
MVAIMFCVAASADGVQTFSIQTFGERHDTIAPREGRCSTEFAIFAPSFE